jgi:hypothetical protein
MIMRLGGELVRVVQRGGIEMGLVGPSHGMVVKRDTANAAVAALYAF